MALRRGSEEKLVWLEHRGDERGDVGGARLHRTLKSLLHLSSQESRRWEVTRSRLHFQKIPLVVVWRVDWKGIHLGMGDPGGGRGSHPGEQRWKVG